MTVDPDIAFNSALTSLRLSNNEISDLPDEIGTLFNLTDLVCGVFYSLPHFL